MCLATPVKIIEKISKFQFRIDGDKIVDTSLVPDAKVGDWLLCHSNLAINRISSKEAQDILKLSGMC